MISLRIRARYESSRSNLIKLMPQLASLCVYDNSAEADSGAGHAPQLKRLLHIENGRIAAHAALAQVPHWAKAILAAAFDVSGVRGA